MTTDDIFERFGGPAKLGRCIGVTTEHASAMKRRGSIPARYWPDLVTATLDEPVTFEELAGIAAGQRPSPSNPEARESV